MVKSAKLTQRTSLESLYHFKADYTRMILKTKCFKRTFQKGQEPTCQKMGSNEFLSKVIQISVTLNVMYNLLR